MASDELKLGIYRLNFQDKEMIYVGTSIGDTVDEFVADLPAMLKMNLGLEIILDNTHIKFTAEALDALTKMYPVIREPQTQVSVPRPIIRETQEHTTPSSLRPSGSYPTAPSKK